MPLQDTTQDTTQDRIRTISFGPLTIQYDDTVLAPRPWTEIQGTWASDLLRTLPAGPVVELCTGAGHIGLRAVHEHPDRRLVVVDASAEACTWVAANAARHGIEIETRHGDLADALGPDEQFALVIADPPWVPAERVDAYPEDPRTAIDGGPDGLDVARLCLRVIAEHLRPDGVALLQLGTEEQVARLADELASSGLEAGELVAVPGSGVVVRLDRAPTPAP